MTQITTKPWSVTSKTGHEITGRADFCADTDEPRPAIVIVHGLTGSMDEYLHQQAAPFFAAQGYDVLRFNLQSQGFPLRHCTLKTHALDLQSVLDGPAAGYQKRFIIGHSYGGPTVMTAQPHQATAICLWDPSFNLPAIWQMMEMTELGDIALLNFGGVEVVVGAEMVAEGRGDDYSAENCLNLSRQLDVPIQVISASEGDEFAVYQQDPRSWHSAGHQENCRQLIPDSDHCFTSPNALQRLLSETHRWFERF
ncbi:MAG: alpha/beta fold hydrolase [Pseudomonadota bacterium]